MTVSAAMVWQKSKAMEKTNPTHRLFFMNKYNNPMVFSFFNLLDTFMNLILSHRDM